MLEIFIKFLLAASAIIVIILVMLQRGKGGGLAGALGGMGGQSAFGTKAGDLFTKITVGVASFWILISILTDIYAPYLGDQITAAQNPNVQQSAPQTPETPSPGKSADSATGKTEKSGKSAATSAAGKGASSADKGAKGSEPAGKSAEKSPEKSVSPTPPPAPARRADQVVFHAADDLPRGRAGAASTIEILGKNLAPHSDARPYEDARKRGVSSFGELLTCF